MLLPDPVSRQLFATLSEHFLKYQQKLQAFYRIKLLTFTWILATNNCVVPENIHTSPMEDLGFPATFLWGRYGYFLEVQILRCGQVIFRQLN